jgi:putative flippase GtrA
VLSRVLAYVHLRSPELVKFGLIGFAGYVVDVGVFNLLRYGGSEGPLHDKPLTAKALSVVAATLVTYAGNRHWTWRGRGRVRMHREYGLFFLLNGIGLAIALSCLFVSHYLLDLTSPLADNISANVVGLALGTSFRFWSYRTFVFPQLASPPEATAPAEHVRTQR